MATDPDELLVDIGRRVAELRSKAGQTQEQMAVSLGVTPRYLQSVEAGDENLTVRSLCRLADAFDVEVLTLFEEPKDRSPRIGRPKKSRDRAERLNHVSARACG